MRNQPPAADFTIRAATKKDVPTILALIKELADFECLSHEVSATEKRIRDTLFGDKPAAEVLIGEDDGSPVSFALFFHTYSTFIGKPGIYLEDLYIKPAYRRRGLGHRMLARVARLAKERNCGRFEWAVLHWNEPAIKAYEKIGAVPMREWTVYRLSGEALDRLANEI